MGVAPISLASIYPAINWENTHERNGFHAPLISDYSSTSKYFLARECDVALERYRNMAVFVVYALYGFMARLSKSIASRGAS